MIITEQGTRGIAYFEYKVINELMHSHIREFGDKLRAVIAFGPLVTGENTYDIELLEVVDHWQGAEVLQADSSNDLPMRGKLFLHFLATGEFENLLRRDNQGLTDTLRMGYKVIYEVPAGYVRHILMHTFGTDENAARGQFLPDPRRPLAG